ncbi:hypothetical protein A8924_7405 [Saccharopolyspora erythraea NRRL 2338]|uniref:Uncharacterized protein n=2 Tax=Saccharopolyspora erythraea TaxID=1836 RepID=A4FQ50_SACEN|nr:hypothetical protein [Saccharopolyspora erythraea]EQD84393.1 hypothetical protein N599_20295 [Saccharopolyspora erythraea D]PFG99821.1 hypothetical protein A8924_7376 [Saccharopolyspora erythraea NRRL 2338]PFG99847.1 hypothetical protein A8924_7405 [Saccharopolyspora erythraea NRRL 2338]QRK89692.1 hypothetical protein JQX30_35115 [Saccharopolyspora erythraea]CAM06175.1 hypothetical protein SACE_7014 [Saccharopolyspora erythraea NRRL 2338]
MSEPRIQIGGKTYTSENWHEIAEDPNVTPANGQVVNVAHGDNHGIQAGAIHGGITFNRN